MRLRVYSLALFSFILILTFGITSQAQVDKPFPSDPDPEKFQQRRARMVERLAKYKRGAITDERVLKAFGSVPRHLYVLEQDVEDAYTQNWIRIGWGQTITDPGMVAWQTQLLELKPTDKVLEIGTGSGFQASILRELTPHVYTIEIVQPLAERSHKLIQNLKYDDKITYKIGDGYFGWPENGPFDKIIVTCAADHIPIPLIQQLKEGGIMVIPVGPAYQRQKMYFVTKDERGRVRKKVLGGVEFVPMTGEIGKHK